MSTTKQANMSTIEIGSRVRCNDGFAAAYVGETGTIEKQHTDVFGVRLWTIRLDTPKPPAASWPEVETIAAAAHCYEVI